MCSRLLFLRFSDASGLVLRCCLPSLPRFYMNAAKAGSAYGLLAGALAAAGASAIIGNRRTRDAFKSCLLLEESKPAPATVKKPVQGNINLEQEMLKRRTVFLNGEVNDDSAKVLVQQLLFFQAEDPNAPVTIYINSGGGLVHSGLAIVDTMLHVSMPLKTVAIGRAFSIAALVLASGTHGHRSAFPNARIMIHEPSCSYPKMQVADMAIKVEELQHTGRTLNRLLSQRLGKSQAEISELYKRDRYMAAADAIELGVIDFIRPAAGDRDRREALSATGKESVVDSSAAPRPEAQAENTPPSSETPPKAENTSPIDPKKTDSTDNSPKMKNEKKR